MRRKTLIFVATAMVWAMMLTACGKTPETTDTPTAAPTSPSAPTKAPTDDHVPTNNPVDTPVTTAEPVDTPAITAEPIDTPVTTAKPVDTSTNENSMERIAGVFCDYYTDEIALIVLESGHFVMGFEPNEVPDFNESNAEEMAWAKLEPLQEDASRYRGNGMEIYVTKNGLLHVTYNGSDAPSRYFGCYYRSGSEKPEYDEFVEWINPVYSLIAGMWNSDSYSYLIDGTGTYFEYDGLFCMNINDGYLQPIDDKIPATKFRGGYSGNCTFEIDGDYLYVKYDENSSRDAKFVRCYEPENRVADPIYDLLAGKWYAEDKMASIEFDNSGYSTKYDGEFEYETFNGKGFVFPLTTDVPATKFGKIYEETIGDEIMHCENVYMIEGDTLIYKESETWIKDGVEIEDGGYGYEIIYKRYKE